jgi:hypothetical protein
MEQWVLVSQGEKSRLFEIEGAQEKEPIEVYAERYSRPVEALHPVQFESMQQHIDEILCEFAQGSTMLLFGAGHSAYANIYHERCDNLSKITAMDMVPEAKLGLRSAVDFLQADILEYEFEEQYDYVFTTHTLEHFTRDQLLNIVVPKLRGVARKALVILVPYGEFWKGEPTHRCWFYENDEMAGLASRYKKIRDGREIVYWIEGTDYAPHENS